VLNSEILKGKYTHEDINLLGEESNGNNATLQSERAINYRRDWNLEEDQHHKEKHGRLNHLYKL
jgi:hypothetical protein